MGAWSQGSEDPGKSLEVDTEKWVPEDTTGFCSDLEIFAQFMSCLQSQPRELCNKQHRDKIAAAIKNNSDIKAFITRLGSFCSHNVSCYAGETQEECERRNKPAIQKATACNSERIKLTKEIYCPSSSQ